jgi:hypothetical protein
MLKAAILLLTVVLASCASGRAKEWSYLAPAKQDSWNALLDWSDLPGVIASIDGHNVGHGYNKAPLSPGRHTITYAYYPAEFGVHPQGTLELSLQAGHAYEFRVDLCYWCSPRRYAVWVRDTTTGELVWGKEPDWPSWWL